MTLSVGDSVRVLEPFNETFTEVYVVTEAIQTEGHPTVYVLGDLGGFVADYLEKV